MYGTDKRNFREFKIVLRNDMDAKQIEERLNALGLEGWVLDDTVCSSGYTTMFIMGRNRDETGIVLNERIIAETEVPKHLA